MKLFQPFLHFPLIVFCFTTLFLESPLIATKYTLDPAHTHLGFKVRHLGIIWVNGSFKRFDGSGEYDEKTREALSARVEIDANSIDTNETDRDKDLRSDHFFDVTNYPKIIFQASRADYRTIEGNKIPTKVYGKLTIRGITREIVLNVNDWGGAAVDPSGKENLAFELAGQIDRRDFGLTWNKPLQKAAGLFVGNEVKLELLIEAFKVSDKLEPQSKTKIKPKKDQK